ncbi:MAG: YciI family protein [Gaiellaceae bacterium]
MELESYAFVLLRRGTKAAEFSEPELERLQAAHLEHLRAMTEAGKLVGAGPFADQPDEALRGLCFYACGVEEARSLAEQDPSVQAGRMAAEVMTWWTEKGTATFHRGRLRWLHGAPCLAPDVSRELGRLSRGSHDSVTLSCVSCLRAWHHAPPNGRSPLATRAGLRR